MLKCFVESKKLRIYMASLVEGFDKSEKKIVSATAIQELLAESTCYKETLDSKTYKVLRFLLKTNGELVFAHEGAPGGFVPSHWQMSAAEPLFAECITAGNAFFNENDKLELINNKSGDFKPSFDSLQFVFPELLKSGTPISEAIEIIQLSPNGVEITSYKVELKELLEFCKSPYLHESLQESLFDFESVRESFSVPALVMPNEADAPSRQDFGIRFSQAPRPLFFSSDETSQEQEADYSDMQLTTTAPRTF